ncbi:hypothetical protein [Actinophytocola sp.]|uniref:hypothetical protein n=1 Tax=Actinophytocola sp. TaxID=1872138 RepID=UPI00389B0267
MQSTMELAELDELVAQLDTKINETEVAEDKATPSLLICSLGCGGSGPWSWYC